MTYVVALVREATPENSQTWEIRTYSKRPALQTGDVLHDEPEQWRVADVFRDDDGEAA